MGRKPMGDQAMTPAERQRRRRRHASDCWIVIYGDALTGFDFYGPFFSEQDALDTAGHAVECYKCDVVELKEWNPPPKGRRIPAKKARK